MVSANPGGVSSRSTITWAAPASSRANALSLWWSWAAYGYGISTDGLPKTVSSESVEAPARHTTRSAVA